MRYLIVLSLLLLGCAKNSSDPASAKGLYSTWSEASGGVLELKNDGTAHYTYFGGLKCGCAVTVTGDSVGTISITSCTIEVFSGGSPVPDCTSLVGLWDFSRSATALALCYAATSTCTTYH